MERSQNQITGDEAVEVFKQTLPKSEWQPYDISPDFGKDHPVELLENRELTGRKFVAQIKGEKRPKYSPDGRVVRFSIETKYIAYFMRLREPLFLILVDTTRRVGYWLSMQEYVLNHLRRDRWTAQKSITLQIPTQNQLCNLLSFRAAVESAILFLAAYHSPGSQATIRADQLRLQNLDPRFEVKIVADEKHQHVEVRAKEPVKISLKFQGEQQVMAAKIEEFLARGVPVEVKPGELEASGSPLFEHAVKEVMANGGTVQFGTTATATVTFREAPEQAAIGWMYAAPATVVAGMKECRVSTSLFGGAVHLDFLLRRNDTQGELTIGAGVRSWVGNPIADLTNLDLLGEFIEKLLSQKITTDILIASSPRFQTVLDFVGSEPLRKLYGFIALIQKAQIVARHFKLQPNLTAEVSRAQWQDIEVLHALVTGDRFERHAEGMTLTMTLEASAIKTMLRDPKVDTADAPLLLRSRHRAFKVFDAEFSLDELRIEMTHARLASSRARLAKRMRHEASHELPLRFIGGKGAMLRIAHASQFEPAA